VPGWDDAVDLTKDPAVIPDPLTPVPPDLRQTIEAAMAKYPERRSAAIPALHAAQDLHGWCSPEAIEQVAAVMQVTPAYLTSVATFYDMLETEPRPPHHDVYVCTNISCSLRGADEFLVAMLAAAAESDDVHVRSFECLGACDIAPMASVDGEFVGPLIDEDADRIIDDLRAGRAVLEHKQLRYRRCVDPGASRAEDPTEEGDR
jgi:NADH:ubiquinone oxidoreductase subunit E